ncbi:MAG: hypothetical protein QM652_12785 [Legionella sp.]|uniref:hypothetical protein n=1 Tax=Legionella sp. TaxID=459 RepID=UPI0039E31479
MIFQLIAYEVLRERIINAIRSFANRYKCDGPTIIKQYGCAYLLTEDEQKQPMKLEDYYSKVPDERRTEIGFLLTCLRLIDASEKKLAEKELILNAATCYTRTMIEDDRDPEKSLYNKIVSRVTTLNSSTLYTSLGFALDIDQYNAPDNDDMSLMCSTIKDFVMEQVRRYKTTADKGAVVHPFSESRIEKFNLDKFISTLNTKIVHYSIKQSSELTRHLKSSASVASNGIFAQGIADSLLSKSEEKSDNSKDKDEPHVSHPIATLC